MNTAPADPRSGWRWLEIEGKTHQVRHVDWGCALEVVLHDRPAAEPIHLPPWRYADHLAGLRAGLGVAGSSAAGDPPLALDLQRYLGAMPVFSDLDTDEQAAMLPVALWWAGGGDPAPAAPPDATGAACIDGQTFYLNGWSERARMAALLACLTEEAEDATGGHFDAVSYLDAMVRKTVRADGPDLDGLATHWALPLIDAVVSMNLVRPETEPLPASGARARAAAEQTLRLCRALGWTPSQVWAAPAAEIDRLRALLDRVEPHHAMPSATAPRRRRLADHPDAVLIRIED